MRDFSEKVQRGIPPKIVKSSKILGPSEQDSQEVSLSSSEEEISSDSELYHSQRSCSWRSGSSCGEYDSEPVDGDVMWDHNATDSEEFDFKAADRIKITDPSVYRDWWWGSGSNKSGWLSAAYIRVKFDGGGEIKEGCVLYLKESQT
ncbi:rho guanine nucleotide exchange factor 4-like [Centruroides sculpturatus]|uniref:rho guanine nucleotide exchange factor 4-like n=1 Tax=Centruroides sculpturatus TaxID=218467 RepID=UPI000C6EFEBE|nr:rho guanine nucleotide exchange factor 4-like [Centruroides sculpturatus]